MTANLTRTWRTVRHLRREQPLARATYRLRRRLGVTGHAADLARSRLVSRPVPEPVRWRPRGAQGLLAGRFSFHARDWPLEPPPWDEEALPQLWRYQLHDFEWAQDLLAHERETGDGRAAALFGRLALDWVDRNPFPRGDGWHPYTVSMRLCAWARALAGLGEGLAPDVRGRLETSFLEQYAWVLTTPERDVLGNHLLENVRALAVGGLLVGGPLGRRGRLRARALLREQIPRQVLPDGGHYERSPMYHLIVLAALREAVDALYAAGIAVGPEPPRALVAMARFGRAMLDARGEPLPLGDSVPEEGPVPPEVESAQEETDRLVLFADSGYAVLRSSDGRDRLVLDVGDLCPDELPAHAHADTLSFVLERDGLPLVVDPGVGEYAEGPWRAFSRSTRAHSTVEIEGEDQAEIHGSFRAGERARALPVRTDGTRGDVLVEGGHDGYRRIPARAVHRRRVVSRRGGGWAVLDRVRSRRPCRIRSFVHLAPDLTVDRSGDGAALRRGGREVATLRWAGFETATVVRGEEDPVQGWVFPGFGRRKPAPVIALAGRCEGDARFSLEID